MTVLLLPQIIVNHAKTAIHNLSKASLAMPSAVYQGLKNSCDNRTKKNISYTFNFTKFDAIPRSWILLPNAAVTRTGKNRLEARVLDTQTNNITYIKLEQNGWIPYGFSVLKNKASISGITLYQIAKGNNTRYTLLSRTGLIAHTMKSAILSPITVTLYLAHKVEALLAYVLITNKPKAPTLLSRFKNCVHIINQNKTKIAAAGVFGLALYGIIRSSSRSIDIPTSPVTSSLPEQAKESLPRIEPSTTPIPPTVLRPTPVILTQPNITNYTTALPKVTRNFQSEPSKAVNRIIQNNFLPISLMQIPLRNFSHLGIFVSATTTMIVPVILMKKGMEVFSDWIAPETKIQRNTDRDIINRANAIVNEAHNLTRNIRDSLKTSEELLSTLIFARYKHTEMGRILSVKSLLDNIDGARQNLETAINDASSSDDKILEIMEHIQNLITEAVNLYKKPNEAPIPQ